MKTLIKNPFVIAIVAFVLGISSHFFYQKYSTSKKLHAPPFTQMDPLFDQFYNEDFFNKRSDPFESMRKMREQMEKHFGSPSEGSGLFDSWFQKRFGGGSASEITQREDNDFVYYDVKISGLEQEKVKVSVTNGILNISGKVEKKNADGTSFYSSEFHRSFPVPANVDSSKVEMEQEKDKLVVKFPKVKT